MWLWRVFRSWLLSAFGWLKVRKRFESNLPFFDRLVFVCDNCGASWRVAGSAGRVGFKTCGVAARGALVRVSVCWCFDVHSGDLIFVSAAFGESHLPAGWFLSCWLVSSRFSASFLCRHSLLRCWCCWRFGCFRQLVFSVANLQVGLSTLVCCFQFHFRSALRIVRCFRLLLFVPHFIMLGPVTLTVVVRLPTCLIV